MGPSINDFYKIREEVVWNVCTDDIIDTNTKGEGVRKYPKSCRCHLWMVSSFHSGQGQAEGYGRRMETSFRGPTNKLESLTKKLFSAPSSLSQEPCRVTLVDKDQCIIPGKNNHYKINQEKEILKVS